MRVGALHSATGPRWLTVRFALGCSRCRTKELTGACAWIDRYATQYTLLISDSWNTLTVLLHPTLNHLVENDEVGMGQLIRISAYNVDRRVRPGQRQCPQQ